jgi:hypothetical protein
LQKLLAFISALAGAIVGVVKLVGLATGNEWLGDNWRAALGYVGVFAFSMYLVLLAVAIVKPRTVVGAIAEVTSGKVVPPGGRQADDTWAARGGAVLAIALYGALLTIVALNPASFWFLGAAALAFAAFVGVGIVARRQNRRFLSTAECPFCLETVKLGALVCRHCGRSLPGDPPEGEFDEWA